VRRQDLVAHRMIQARPVEEGRIERLVDHRRIRPIFESAHHRRGDVAGS
jgi:hypothetical protein